MAKTSLNLSISELAAITGAIGDAAGDEKLKAFSDGLRVASNEIKSATKEANKYQESVAKLEKNFIKIGGTLKGVQSALTIMSGAFKAARGDIEGMYQAATRIPLIGGIVREAVGAWNEITGVTASRQRNVLMAEQVGLTEKYFSIIRNNASYNAGIDITQAQQLGSAVPGSYIGSKEAIAAAQGQFGVSRDMAFASQAQAMSQQAQAQVLQNIKQRRQGVAQLTPEQEADLTNKIAIQFGEHNKNGVFGGDINASLAKVNKDIADLTAPKYFQTSWKSKSEIADQMAILQAQKSALEQVQQQQQNADKQKITQQKITDAQLKQLDRDFNNASLSILNAGIIKETAARGEGYKASIDATKEKLRQQMYLLHGNNDAQKKAIEAQQHEENAIRITYNRQAQFRQGQADAQMLQAKYQSYEGQRKALETWYNREKEINKGHNDTLKAIDTEYQAQKLMLEKQSADQYFYTSISTEQKLSSARAVITQNYYQERIKQVQLALQKEERDILNSGMSQADKEKSIAQRRLAAEQEIKANEAASARANAIATNALVGQQASQRMRTLGKVLQSDLKDISTNLYQQQAELADRQDLTQQQKAGISGRLNSLARESRIGAAMQRAMQLADYGQMQSSAVAGAVVGRTSMGLPGINGIMGYENRLEAALKPVLERMAAGIDEMASRGL